jgi:methionyl-tRNA formyltransferase
MSVDASRRAEAIGRVVLVGAVHEAAPALDALLACPLSEVVLVVTSPADTAGGRHASASGLVDLVTPATRAGVPVVRVEDVNAPDVVAAIAVTMPDLLVVVGWTRLIRPPLLAVPRRGCVGFHASLLPRHRGRAPVNWAIIRGEKICGNTMMLLDPGADTGDIVDQRPVVIGTDDTCGTVYDRVGQVGAQMLLHHLPALLAGTAPRRRQPVHGDDVLPKRTPDMGLIDWSRPAGAVHDWVRALAVPYPGAFTTWLQRRVMIWRTSPPADGPSSGEPPGTVLEIGAAGVSVASGQGTLLITEMGFPGEIPHAAADWCGATGLRVGARFDPVSTELSAWTQGLGPLPAGVGA